MTVNAQFLFILAFITYVIKNVAILVLRGRGQDFNDWVSNALILNKTF